MAEHPPFIPEAGSGGAPPKDLIANRTTASAAPAGALPDDLFPMRRQSPRTDKPGTSPDPKSKIPGTEAFATKDEPAPGTSHARTLSQPKPFKLHG